MDSQDDSYTTYLAHGGKLHPKNHAEVRRRTTQTGRVYNSAELSGLAKAHEVAEHNGLSIPQRVAAAYHHLVDSFANSFRQHNSQRIDEKAVLIDALAMDGDSNSIARLH